MSGRLLCGTLSHSAILTNRSLAHDRFRNLPQLPAHARIGKSDAPRQRRAARMRPG